ncbi:MAG: hypothetical protein K8R35_10855 [Bacteroidales bacterium]|nr:hypothetical protein [Bacteroidales bacterium]
MAEIGKIQIFGILTFLFFSISGPVSSQQTENSKKKKVEILHADEMIAEGTLKRLIGNVFLKHKKTLMTCDSAHYFETTNLVNAFSNVHIYRGDTLHLYGDYLIYDSDAESAELIDSVIMIDNDTYLYTDHIFYNMITEVADYKDGGKIIDGENRLTSIIGLYFTETEIFHFKDSVKLVNPDYTMYSDTLIYDTKTEIAYFIGPTKVIGDSLYAKCEDGWYDTKQEVSLFKINAMIDNKKQIVTGDSLYYERENGYGTAHFDVTISDLTKDIIVKGNKAWYYKDPEQFMITDSAQFIQKSNDDFLYLHSDTLWAVTVSDTIGEFRLLRSFYGCRIFSDGLQSQCDSLSYSFRDSVIRLYYKPVLWTDANQLTSDSIALFTKNGAMDHMELYNNAFIVKQVDSLRFNQIKGRNLFGYFMDNSLYKLEIRGNGENIYYAIEKNELVGVNQAKCSNMDIYLEEGEIKDMYMLKTPDGTLDPPYHVVPLLRRLENFIWLDSDRPKDRYDIFRRPGEDK